MDKQNIRIHLRAYDNKILDLSTVEIVNNVNGVAPIGKPSTTSVIMPDKKMKPYPKAFGILNTQK